jgi:hypothetical protein
MKNPITLPHQLDNKKQNIGQAWGNGSSGRAPD